MMSIERQCNEAVELLRQIQECVERCSQRDYGGGRLIPCRSEDFETYIQRARDLVGVIDVRRTS